MKVTSFIIPRIPGIEQNVGKAFNLYRFLATHLDKPARELASKITQNGKPLFSENDIKNMQAVIASQKNTPYFKQAVRSHGQTGGAASAAPAPSAPAANIPVAIPVATPVVMNLEDPTRSKFWDKFIRKISHSIGTYIPFPISQICKNWEFYMFFLYSLEQMELIGPFVSSALDSITLSLPVLSDLASEGIETIFMLLPIPYAALIGQVAGYVIGTLFLLYAIMLNMNRKHFGSAFKVSLELIPMFGDILAESAVNFEVAMERTLASRSRMLGSVKKFSPTAYSIADYYVPSINIKNTLPPDIFSRKTYNAIGSELEHYALEKLPIPDEKIERASEIASKVMNVGPALVETATSLITNPAELATSALSAATNKAVAQASNAVTSAANKAVAQASNAVSSAANKAVAQASNAVTSAANKAVRNKNNKTIKGKQKGGRHQSTRRSRSSK